MRSKIKIFISILSIIVGGAVEAYAQGSLNFVSFFPPPIASYDRVRLIPRDVLSEPCEIGTIFVQTNGNVNFCIDNGSGSGIWDHLMPAIWKQVGDNVFPTDTASNPNLKVGIGTTTPQHLFWVQDLGDVDKRIFYDGIKGAFRAGEADSWTWDDVVVGQGSTGFGYYARAEGDYSIALGNSGALGTGSIALEGYAGAQDYNVGIGGAWAQDTISDIGHVVGIGAWAMTSNQNAIALGYSACAEGVSSFALGKNAHSSGDYAAAIGGNFEAAGDYSFSIILDDTSRTLSQDNTLSIMGGKVGVGTVDPSVRLEIGDGTAGAAVSINKGDDVAADMLRFDAGEDTPFAVFHAEANEDLVLKTTTGGKEVRLGVNSIQRIEIEEDDGNIGIGTSSPKHKLHVQKDNLNLDISNPALFPDDGLIVEGNPAIMQIFSQNESAISSSLLMEEGSGSLNNKWVIWRSANAEDTGSFYITYSTPYGWWISTNPVLAITKTGNFGLGDKNWMQYGGGDDPDYPIEMAGGAYCTAGGVWTDVSSKDKKKDIQLLSDNVAINVLHALTPVTFRYKNIPDVQRVGFIAEDVPDLVAAQGRRGLSSLEILAVLTKVAQQQQKEIERLKEILDEYGK